MAWLAKLLPGVGSGLTIPLLVITLIVVGGKLWERRDDRLVDAGKQSCNSSWLVAFSKAQREAARSEAQRAHELLAEERTLMEGLQNDLEQTRQKYAGYIPGDDPRCLSDSVRELLRKRYSVD